MVPAATKETVREWANAHGLQMRKKCRERGEWDITVAPVALSPAKWPTALYQAALQAQPIFNKLILKICTEKVWLMGVCTRLEGYDPFVKRLKELWLQSAIPRTRVGIFRSDYLLHQQPDEAGEALALKQVEINTIAASFPILSDKVVAMHHSLGWESVVENEASDKIVSCLLTAVNHYRRNANLALDEKCAIVMVVQPDEENYFDQQGLSSRLESEGLLVERMTMAELGERCRKTNEDIVLHESGHRVAVVYFRAGYAPEDYQSELDWSGRALVERAANVIKIPDLALHLAGLKKVQQELTNVHTLKRFLPNESERALVMHTFVEILSLDADEEGDRNVARALNDPHRWVVKPQREGGGHNIYGRDVVRFMRETPATDRASHILMELIRPPMGEPSTLLRDDNLWVGPSISELGIYGIIIYCTEEQAIKLNDTAGYLVRTKPSQALEGGVAAGYAYLNSLQLC